MGMRLRILVSTGAIMIVGALSIQTTHGRLSITTKESRLASPRPQRLTSTGAEQDYPSLALQGEDVYLVYVEFKEGSRPARSWPGATSREFQDLDSLARQTGGDQVMM